MLYDIRWVRIAPRNIDPRRLTTESETQAKDFSARMSSVEVRAGFLKIARGARLEVDE
jgi:hypothetical protein